MHCVFLRNNDLHLAVAASFHQQLYQLDDDHANDDTTPTTQRQFSSENTYIIFFLSNLCVSVRRAIVHECSREQRSMLQLIYAQSCLVASKFIIRTRNQTVVLYITQSQPCYGEHVSSILFEFDGAFDAHMQFATY